MLFSCRGPDGRQLTYPHVSRRTETSVHTLVELLLKCGVRHAASARQGERYAEPSLEEFQQQLAFLLPNETAPWALQQRTSFSMP
ncbi:hypothetical protein CQ14_39385 [Bradyrhizobium lablabi]|uniref:Uncharacterized protein n=1 Tax=Bradyrhizobium lablabi TaxID=722472 RepID=A0A0R3MF92_9BRAD|nr:hypothetical protein CQ14_39385 [Bradyrhizobium lablabi]